MGVLGALGVSKTLVLEDQDQTDIFRPGIGVIDGCLLINQYYAFPCLLGYVSII